MSEKNIAEVKKVKDLHEQLVAMKEKAELIDVGTENVKKQQKQQSGVVNSRDKEESEWLVCSSGGSESGSSFDDAASSPVVFKVMESLIRTVSESQGQAAYETVRMFRMPPTRRSSMPVEWMLILLKTGLKLSLAVSGGQGFGDFVCMWLELKHAVQKKSEAARWVMVYGVELFRKDFADVRLCITNSEMESLLCVPPADATGAVVADLPGCVHTIWLLSAVACVGAGGVLEQRLLHTVPHASRYCEPASKAAEDSARRPSVIDFSGVYAVDGGEERSAEGDVQDGGATAGKEQ
ncbi:uncharacterized protein MONOS_13709 [Monocercomonoides exilis]|uniref:uncharacterized protein n=1 Tax=Monocercomonoides exilis TaxID=2049356 RepID=UPI003559D6A4|nr:hypothetical protein MONOS_13709 [Monocercomonoides exilis]|eukprot:MONOS_13709.1-p1 / transcript=MONOS_13709.1 / gene=MONOS_13709 / organism=Monocercomonoides_exilis_PA203 / gene_product=unspecified product / transcript_product=unspecified product / location=Mono_scaffold00869:9357-11444(+) / protein_length=294 / sequence_SO=supercontig / SO=protein_coding / is_pseudo=false